MRVMRMVDGRLLKVIMHEALKMGSKVRWVKEYCCKVWRWLGGEVCMYMS